VDDLATIHMFWHGAPLSRVERVSMASFVAHGHPLVLHVYDEPTGVPAGVTVRDAAAVLPRSAIFRQRRTGSLAVFADWFRYRLLHEQGGVWADADMVCLRPLRPERPEVFGWQDDEVVSNALLGAPPGHPLTAWMGSCCERPSRVLPYDPPGLVLRKWRRRLLEGDRQEAIGFGEVGPRGLTRALRHLGLLELALPRWHFFPVHFTRWRSIFDGSLDVGAAALERSTTLHLWNEMIRRAPGFDRDARFPAGSLFEVLCARYLGD
jgi:hypothetical protein